VRGLLRASFDVRRAHSQRTVIFELRGHMYSYDTGRPSLQLRPLSILRVYSADFRRAASRVVDDEGGVHGEGSWAQHLKAKFRGFGAKEGC
jgi:hypothetical protein